MPTSDPLSPVVRPTGLLLAAALVLAGCGDGDATADASVDAGAAVDVPAVDVPRADVPALDVPALDVPRADVPRADVAPLDVPAVDVPAIDAPPADAPASDASVPAILAVPPGQVEVLRVAARGVQIYTCAATTADAGAAYQWTFRAPEAALYQGAARLFGTHFGGPTWRAVDGSQITGAVQQRADAPIAGAIPWLMLRVTASTGVGALARVTSIQRLNTRGGVAPGTACNSGNAGAEARVEYEADYAFWAPASDAGSPPPPLPATLELPEAGLSVLLRAAAQGDQIYRCAATAPDGGVGDAGTAYQWAFVAPEATLRDSAGATIGTHFAGPTWRGTDGNQVVGAVAARADAPVAGAIPWLLLRATSNAGAGPFARARFVHRVATTDGVAPTASCDATSVGTERRVAYTADYYFWGAP